MQRYWWSMLNFDRKLPYFPLFAFYKESVWKWRSTEYLFIRMWNNTANSMWRLSFLCYAFCWSCWCFVRLCVRKWQGKTEDGRGILWLAVASKPATEKRACSASCIEAHAKPRFVMSPEIYILSTRPGKKFLCALCLQSDSALLLKIQDMKSSTWVLHEVGWCFSPRDVVTNTTLMPWTRAHTQTHTLSCLCVCVLSI